MEQAKRPVLSHQWKWLCCYFKVSNLIHHVVCGLYHLVVPRKINWAWIDHNIVPISYSVLANQLGELSPTTSAALVALALFPGLHCLQFLITCKSKGEGLGFRCAGVTSHHASMYSHATEKTDLLFCTNHGDNIKHTKTRQLPRENNIKHTKQNLVHIAKKKQLLDLQRLQRNCSSVVMLQTKFCSRGRTFLSAGTCLVLLASLQLHGDINVNMYSCGEPVTLCVPQIMW